MRSLGAAHVVHTNVIQLRKNMPADIGAVLWSGLGSSPTTPYIPFYYGIKDIPDSFKHALSIENSAGLIFKNLSGLVFTDYNKHIGMVLPEIQKFESEMLDSQRRIEKQALQLYNSNPEKAQEFLTEYVSGLCRKALINAKDFCLILKK